MSKMHEQRLVQPTWEDIETFALTSDQMKMLKHISHQGQIFRFLGNTSSQSLFFRHDRVSDWLSASAIAKELVAGNTSQLFLSEPYYSRVIGMSLNRNGITHKIVRLIKTVNPLALFFGLQEFSNAETIIQKAVVSNIDEWLKEQGTHGEVNDNLRWECLSCMANTDSIHVLDFLKYFKEKGWSYYEAGFRNGDLEKGIELCRMNNPGVNNPSHEKTN